MNAFCHCCFNCTCNSIAVNRVYDKNRNILCNKVFNVANLFCNVIACICNADRNAKVCCCSFCAFNESYKEWVVLCGNGKADAAVANNFHCFAFWLVVCVNIVFCYKCNFNRDRFFDCCAADKCYSIFYSCRTDKSRLLCDCACHLACFDCFDSIVCCVKAYNHNFFARAADCFNCTESHFVICCKYSLNVAVALKDVFHYGHTFCAVKVCCLACNNCKVCICNVVEACAAVDCCGSTRCAFKLCNFNAFAKCINDKLCCKLCTENVVGSNLTFDFNIVYCAVNADNFNAFCFCSFNCACNSVAVNRVNNENGNTFGNKVFNVGSLFCNVVTCVCNAKFNAKFISLCLCTFHQCNTEWVVLCGNGKADCAVCCGICLCEIFLTVNCNHTACHGQDHSKAENQ